MKKILAIGIVALLLFSGLRLLAEKEVKDRDGNVESLCRKSNKPIWTETTKDFYETYSPPSFFDDMDYFNDTLWQKSDWYNGDVFMCGWRPDHITHESSIMTITLDNQPSHGYSYTSGEYATRNESYLHGYIEGRIKFSCRESGTVASLFTYRENPLSEIDIEILGKDPTVLWCSIHAPSGSYGDTVQLGFDASQDFHTYGFEWTPTTVKWFVDSQLVYTADGSVLPSDVPVSIMANFWNGDYVWTGPFNYPGTHLTTEYDWIKYTRLSFFSSITHPRGGYLYIAGGEITPTLSGNTIIIGGITIEADAEGENGIIKIEFYIDDELKNTDTEKPYQWLWNERSFGRHEIKVIAYDNEGDTAEDRINVMIFNLGVVN